VRYFAGDIVRVVRVRRGAGVRDEMAVGVGFGLRHVVGAVGVVRTRMLMRMGLRMGMRMLVVGWRWLWRVGRTGVWVRVRRDSWVGVGAGAGAGTG
jgi:hypothetical protein